MKTFKQYVQEDLLLEVFVIGNKRPKGGDNVIAYNKWIWVFPDYKFNEYVEDINSKIKPKDNFEEIYDLQEYVRENPDVISGSISGDGYLYVDDTYRHSKFSSTLQKLVKALKLKGIEVSYYDAYSEYEQGELIDNIKEFSLKPSSQTFYHGTSYKKFESMKKLGLKPMDVSNFTDIVHRDKVFITVNKEKAYFHANTAAEHDGSFPLIVSLKLPDPDKLVLDYDVAIDLYGKDNPETIRLGYSDISNYATRNINPMIWAMINSPDIKDVTKRIRKSGENLNTKLGIFGYKGRISAKFFQGVILDPEAFEKYYYTYYAGFDDVIENDIKGLSLWDEYSLKELKELEDSVEEQYEEELRELEDEEEDY